MTTGPVMSPTNVRWSLCALWVASTLLAFTLLNASPGPGWIYLAAVSLIPPALLRGLWNAPAATIAPVARPRGDRR